MRHHAVDVASMLKRCRALDWSVDAIDWEAPGRERVSAESAYRMRDFLADLVWIEHIGAGGFVAMGRQAAKLDPTLGELLLTFAREEERHAEAERRLMVRWGLLPRDAMPKSSPAMRRTAEFLATNADAIPLSVYSALLPMFEIGLDGGLLKFLTEDVEDPVAKQVFELVNRDEARHLATDFHLLEWFAREAPLTTIVDLARTLGRPALLETTLFAFLPMLEHMITSAHAMGVDPADLENALRKYRKLGRENPTIRRHAGYWLLSPFTGMYAKPTHPYRRVGDALLRVTNALEALSPTEVRDAHVLPRAA